MVRSRSDCLIKGVHTNRHLCLPVRVCVEQHAIAQQQASSGRQHSSTTARNGKANTAAHPLTPSPSPLKPGPCPTWVHNTSGYYDSKSGNLATFHNLTVAEAQSVCCKNIKCSGFSYDPKSGR